MTHEEIKNLTTEIVEQTKAKREVIFAEVRKLSNEYNKENIFRILTKKYERV